ncbi:MAG: peptidase domain-containing ABC transporter, partial [Burkholderiaceae bacterium]|nr:peptidase domain-containing ABC transporter [Burkholderiaceae bacterium]
MNQQNIDARAFFWALQGLCALHRKPFSIELAQQQCAAPYTNGALIAALQSYGLDAKTSKGKSKSLQREAFPLMVWLQDEIVDVTPIESPQAADELSAPSAQVPQS